MFLEQHLASTDPEVLAAIKSELERQRSKLELIASENFTSPAVMAAGASVMTNKYAEGYPGRRYYGGCEFVDRAEELARRRACEVFGCEWANVQPHSGSQANMGVYFTLLKPGDAILGLRLDHGGHLTHGSPVSFSGRMYEVISYGVDRETGRVDMDQVADLAARRRPAVIVVGASAYPRIWDFDAFARIGRETGARVVVDMAHVAGLVAAGVHPSPIGKADAVTTTTHKTLRGPRGGMILGDRELGSRIDGTIFPGIQGGPLMHQIAAKAVALKEAQAPEFAAYQKQTLRNAGKLAAVLMEHGVKLVSDGTDNHLMLIDLTGEDLTGLQAEEALERAGITTNKNPVPFDPRPPKVTSGLRIGVPAVTTRGMGEEEMETIGRLIVEVLSHPDEERILAGVRAAVEDLCRRFPLYEELEEA